MPNNKTINAMVSLSLLVLLPVQVMAASNQEVMKEDKTHVDNWNNFSDQLLALHKKQIARFDIKQTEKSGGYADHPDFYNEIKYQDKKSGNLISEVQWEKKNPGNVHSMQVYVYDDKGRIVRDYGVAFLPFNRNAPIQTLINIHGYNKKMHAFKQFDGSGDVIYQFCEGSFNGKEAQMRLFEDDLVATDYDARQLVKSPLYKACFNGISDQLGKYIKPQ